MSTNRTKRLERRKTAMSKTHWLIEYVGAVPCAVYVPVDYGETGGYYTCNPWRARSFETEAEAREWMRHPNDSAIGDSVLYSVPYTGSWRPVEHAFALSTAMIRECKKQLEAAEQKS